MAEDLATLAYTGPDRRAAVPDSLFGLPQWARIVALVGIPGAIACFLVWVGSQELPTIRTELVAFRMDAEQARTAEQAQVVKEEQIYRMLQKICAQLGRTDVERLKCFEP